MVAVGTRPDFRGEMCGGAYRCLRVNEDDERRGWIPSSLRLPRVGDCGNPRLGLCKESALDKRCHPGRLPALRRRDNQGCPIAFKGIVAWVVKVPFPLPRSTERVPAVRLVQARSMWPSLLKSAA